MSLSKGIFWLTLTIGGIRDFIPSVENIENYAFLAVGMLVALVAYVLFDRT